MNAFYTANRNMSASHASANYAEASSPCTQHAAHNSIISILDAIIMASIIICTLLVSVLVLGLSLLVLVLLAILLGLTVYTPRERRTD